MKVRLTSVQAIQLASCIGDMEMMAGRTIPEPQCPARGGFVCVAADDNRLILRAAEREPYLLAQVAVGAEVLEPGQAWIATLPLADLLTKRPEKAAEVEMTADPGAGYAKVVFSSASGRTIRVRRAAALTVTEDNALRTVIPAPGDPVFTVALTPELVTNLAGQVRQHDELVSNRPRTVWLTLEDTQMRLEAWISDYEATAVDFPLDEPPEAAGQVNESLGVLLGRAVARIGKVVTATSGAMEIRTMLSNSVARQCLLLRAYPYEFVLPLTEVTDEGTTKTIHYLRTCLASDTTVSVEVDGEHGLISQICRESTGALRRPRAVLDFYHRHGKQLLQAHVTVEAAAEGPAAEVYSGEYPAQMSAPLNRRIVLDHKRLAAALSVFRGQGRIRLHLEPQPKKADLLGITPATLHGQPIEEFQASDIRTVLAGMWQGPMRLPDYDPNGPIHSL
ncbi:hypothetical protein N8J89_16280 [Crossiella sp. CA-258035]|uniref:hypothetical protein n=1 Tax=Crossiella sp. CA-258035 TaxID=2981138 RepID=UPI0024BCD35F|nr:hypothetical protein [Crossiella sp. CA-258035]WHT22556.1 hypothetical protein N8J89_16280 [Crossiella sp. CA-258035]